MKTNFLPSCLLAAGMLLTGNSVFAQTTTSQSGATYTDGNPDGYAISLGQTYRYSLGYAHSYVGFNIKPLSNGQWNLGSDGGNNGGAMITGNMAGALQFITVPTNSANPASRAVYDSDLNPLTRMVINRYGQVKIGVTEPGGSHADFKLSVDGKIVAKSVYVTSANWADYVFDKEYRLAPLSEVEAYVKANKHLPEVPTTCEVEEKGIDVATINTLLLKKVEELTLHLIELNKRLEAVEAAKH
ncbi:MAG: hypothetical protein JWP58_540 [Hymenobacter sp.]|nr:hypothetical protein [Hymenobacter sp.]